MRLIQPGAGQLFRGRTVDELRDAHASRAATSYDLSTVTDFAAGGAPRPVEHVRRLNEEMGGGAPLIGYGLTETNAAGRGQLARQLPRQARVSGSRVQAADRDRGALDDGGNEAPAGASGARSRFVRSSTCSATGTMRPPPARRSRPTAGCARGTLAISTRTAICSSSTARRTSSSAAARTSRARRWKTRCTSIRRSPRSPCSACPDERLGEVPAAVVHPRGGRKCRSRRALIQFRQGSPRGVQGALPDLVLRDPAAAAGDREDRQGERSATNIARSPLRERVEA